MTDYQSQIDRPFRSKSDQQSEVAIQTQYHRLDIPAVVAAFQIGGRPTAVVVEKQMG